MLNIPTPTRLREPVKIPEKEKIEKTLVFINNVLQDDPESDEKINDKIKFDIDTKEIPWWTIIMLQWKKDINVLKDRMYNDMQKYPEIKKRFLAYFIDEATLEWFDVQISQTGYSDIVIDDIKYLILPYKFEKKLLQSPNIHYTTIEKNLEITKDNIKKIFDEPNNEI